MKKSRYLCCVSWSCWSRSDYIHKILKVPKWPAVSLIECHVFLHPVLDTSNFSIALFSSFSAYQVINFLSIFCVCLKVIPLTCVMKTTFKHIWFAFEHTNQPVFRIYTIASGVSWIRSNFFSNAKKKNCPFLPFFFPFCIDTSSISIEFYVRKNTINEIYAHVMKW